LNLRVHPVVRIATLSLVVLAIADPAFAQSTGGGPGAFLENFVDWLRSDIIHSLAILAVIATGGACLTGRLDWGRGLWVLAGIALMYGAREIVDMISGGSS
jgi:type IV secretion system protein VirB2